MKPDFLVKKPLLISGLLVIALAVSSFHHFLPVKRLSMKLVSKMLQNGKSITTQADVYYRLEAGLLVTHITVPVEYLVITNDKGEFKMYDFKANEVSQMQASDFSSENSFIHDFFRGNINDMGLRRLGFKLKNTRVEGNKVITDWIPPLGAAPKLNRVELVHENYSPIYLGFFGKKDKPVSKIYYYNYKKIGDIDIPLIITELQYHPNGDSSITKRTYSDILTNEQVDEKWLNFQIPANAKIIK